MNRLQVASYLSPTQMKRIKYLADMENLSLSAMVALLIDEEYEANFTNEEENESEIND